MYLFINTTTPQVSYIVLGDKKKILAVKKIQYRPMKRPSVLACIDAVMKKAQMSPSSLHGVAVIVGPGQFSSLRTGIAIANTFGYVLHIPVAGILAVHGTTPETFFQNSLKKFTKMKRENMVIPQYGAEPNIGK